MIRRQSAELDELRKQVQDKVQDDALQERLQQREKEIQRLMEKLEQQKQTTNVQQELEEREKMIREKDKQLQELQEKWKNEQAAAKPELQQVTDQLDELKQAVSLFFDSPYTHPILHFPVFPSSFSLYDIVFNPFLSLLLDSPIHFRMKKL